MTFLLWILWTVYQGGFLKFGFFGMICIIIAYLIHLLNPLEMVATSMLSIREGSYAFNLFKAPPLDMFINVYVWNITNGERFLAGLDKKLKVVEAGPYVYQEILENRNATFNPNGTLTYIPTRRTIFIREKSVGDPTEDIITSVNVPMLGLSTLASDLSFFAALAVSTLVKSTSSEPLLNLTVHDFLWGYDDGLIALASNVVPSIIPFKKFGLLDRMFDDGTNVVTINLPEAVERIQKEAAEVGKNKVVVEAVTKSHGPLSLALFGSSEEEDDAVQQEVYKPLIRDYSIDMWNGSPGLHHWGWTPNEYTTPEENTACNTLQGNYDGTLFPRNISKNEVFKYYRKCFCRTLPIEFTHEGKLDGVKAYWFKLADHAFESKYDDPETSCFCPKKQCMKRGLGNITPCYWNIPAAVSLPHFYNSDPSLVEGVEGLNPIKEKHDSVIALQPQIGVPMKVESRVQINLVMGSTRFNTKIEKFQNTAIPIFWAEIKLDRLTDELIFLLQMLFITMPPIQTGFSYFLAVVGVSCISFAILSYAFLTTKTHSPYPIGYISSSHNATTVVSGEGGKRRKNRDIRYSAVRIFPLIGREMEKYYDQHEDDRLVVNKDAV